MSRQIQLRRGTATEHENFTGAIGELTMDTTNNTLRLHDGTTAGGHTISGVGNIKMPDITQIMPNYQDTQNATLPFTANTCGWLFGHIYVRNGTGTIYVNNKQIIFVGSWSESGQNFPFTIPVRPGDIVTKDESTVDFLVFTPIAGC